MSVNITVILKVMPCTLVFGCDVSGDAAVFIFTDDGGMSEKKQRLVQAMFSAMLVGLNLTQTFAAHMCKPYVGSEFVEA
jgi:hypothetical protein